MCGHNITFFARAPRVACFIGSERRGLEKDELIFGQSEHRIRCGTDGGMNGRDRNYREREGALGGGEPGYAAAVGAARYARTDRDEIRVRDGAVRRLHGTRGWGGDTLMHDSHHRGLWTEMADD